MALMSAAIPVAASTDFVCRFTNYQQSVNVLILFYTDADGNVELSPQAGDRDVSVTTTQQAYAGHPNRPTEIKRDVVSSLVSGTTTLAAGETDELLFGAGAGNATFSAAPNTTPGTAVSYRIFVEAPGSSSTG